MANAALRLFAIALLTGSRAAASGPEDVRLLGLDGRVVAALPRVGDPTTVFVFASTDCPISKRYAPELRRLYDGFAPAGVRFWLVYPDPDEAPAEIRRHTEEFGYGFTALRDPQHGLVRFAGVRVTPEAAVYVGAQGGARLVYRGRIDDRNVAYGRTRPAPTTRDLEDVLAALGQGKPVPTRTSTAIGCSIVSLE